ncbi:MAG: formate dehydrogenase accessory protein FdhE [Pirellulales bacterium]|nr:formate dehydrogenase accessory protein FdhE [Pirellulales bacterium]
MANEQSRFERTEVISRLEALIGQEHISADYVRFRIELLKAQAAVCDRLAGSRGAGHRPPTEDAPSSPALGADDVPWDDLLLKELLDRLAAALRDHDGQSEDLARLAAASAHEPQVLVGLAGTVAFGPDEAALAGLAQLAERLDVAPDALLFFGRVLAAPFVTEAAGRYEQRGGKVLKSSGGCPMCGSPPGLARLLREEGQEGRRVLCCCLCGWSWAYSRIECPFCRGQGGLDVLCLDDADPEAIEACRQCRGYLKTVDERKLPEGAVVVPLVVTTATLHLDLIAAEKGYVGGPPYGALQ